MYKSGKSSHSIINFIIILLLNLGAFLSRSTGSAAAFIFSSTEAELNCSSLCQCDTRSTHHVLDRHLQRHLSFMGSKYRDDYKYVSMYTDFLGFYVLIPNQMVDIKCVISDEQPYALSTLLNGVENLRHVSLEVECRNGEEILWDVPTYQVSVKVFYGKKCKIVAVDDSKGVLIPMNTWIFEAESCGVDCLNQIDTRFTMNTIVLSVTGAVSNEIPKSWRTVHMLSLININLQANGFKDYKCELTYSRYVDTINLNRNKLTKFPKCILYKHSKLRKGLRFLSLSHNSIDDITPLYNDSTTVSTIHMIDLSNNLISEIGTFRKLQKLSVLDLSSNVITEINDDAFQNLVDLKQLHLQNNRIHYVGSVAFRNNANLLTLNLHSNSLTSVRQEQFPVSANHLQLDLRRNKLHFPPFADCAEKNDFSTGIKVQSTANPYHCNCAMIRMQECLNFLNTNKINISDAFAVYVDLDTMKCARPPENKGKQIMKLSFTESCIVEQNCPQSCSCLLLNKVTIQVDCSARRLLELPDQIPTYPNTTSKMYLSHNPLQLLSYRSYFTNLTELHVDNCLITSVTPTAIAALQNVSVLALHNNLIKRLPSNTQNITLKRASNVTLHNNRWACSCDSLWLPSWITKHKEVLWMPGSIVCEYLGKPVETFLASDVNCSSYAKFEMVVIIPLALGAIVSTVFTIRHQHEELRHLLFSKLGKWIGLNEVSDENCYYLYDAFICFGEDSYKWVVDTLVPRLEGGPRKYKLCLHWRDFPFGTSMIGGFPWAIKLSHYSLLLLSKPFMEKEWCITDLRKVFQRLLMTASRLIIIVTDDLTPDDVTADLRAYMNTHEYLRIDDPYFWENLEIHLPPKVTADNDLEERPGTSPSGGGDALVNGETINDTAAFMNLDDDRQLGSHPR